jgi:hypothetical protein
MVKNMTKKTKKKSLKSLKSLGESAPVKKMRMKAEELEGHMGDILSEKMEPALKPLKQNLKDAKPLLDPIRKKVKKNAGEIKAVSLAALTAATGDPEAMKTIIDVLAHGASAGIEGVTIKDKRMNGIRQKTLKVLNHGADKLMRGLTWFQKNGAASNKSLREKYGRKK